MLGIALGHRNLFLYEDNMSRNNTTKCKFPLKCNTGESNLPKILHKILISRNDNNVSLYFVAKSQICAFLPMCIGLFACFLDIIFSSMFVTNQIDTHLKARGTILPTLFRDKK
jgi:hypothetical protein